MRDRLNLTWRYALNHHGEGLIGRAEPKLQAVGKIHNFYPHLYP